MIARAAAFSKRNVAEALDGMVAAGLVSATPVGNERRYFVDRAAWAQLLDLDPRLPSKHRDWPALLGAVRRIARGLADPRLDDLSPYMRASAARDLMEGVERDLLTADVSVRTDGLVGEAFWDGFCTTIDRTTAALVR